MSHIIAITFDDPHEAERVRDSLSEVEHQGRLNLDDSAVAVKDSHGRLHVHNEVDRGIKVGALGGGMVGLLIGLIFGGPIGSMLVGLFGGAVGRLLVEHPFTRRVGLDRHGVSVVVAPGLCILVCQRKQQLAWDQVTLNRARSVERLLQAGHGRDAITATTMDARQQAQGGNFL